MNKTLLSKIKETLNNSLNEIDYINILHNLKNTLNIIDNELKPFKINELQRWIIKGK